MTRTTVTLPRELNFFLEGAVSIGSFSSKSEVIQEAIDAAFENEHHRVAAALALYNGDEIDSVGAFKLADVEDQDLRSVLMENLDIEHDHPEVRDEDILTTIFEDFSIDVSDQE